MSNDPNLKAAKEAPKKGARTVGMYDRPTKAAFSPALLIGLLVLVLIIVALVIFLLQPH